MTTPFLDEVYNHVDFDRDLVFKFFTVFSLFEYALKRAGFARSSGSNNDVQPNWETFANAIEQQFNPQATEELKQAIDYMTNRPVMRQVLHNGNLRFVRRVKPQNQSDIVWLSVLIRSVRNNLFHGGKFRYDRPRDTELIQSSLIILEAWTHCHGRVKQELENIR